MTRARSGRAWKAIDEENIWHPQQASVGWLAIYFRRPMRGDGVKDSSRLRSGTGRGPGLVLGNRSCRFPLPMNLVEADVRKLQLLQPKWNEPPAPKMGSEETLALTPPSRAEANPVIFSRIATAGEGPALSPRRGGKHAQFPEFSRPLVWNCFMGTHVGCYEVQGEATAAARGAYCAHWIGKL